MTVGGVISLLFGGRKSHIGECHARPKNELHDKKRGKKRGISAKSARDSAKSVRYIAPREKSADKMRCTAQPPGGL